jgi:hypothetical protein
MIRNCQISDPKTFLSVARAYLTQRVSYTLAAYSVKGLRWFTGTVMQPSARDAKAKIRHLGDAYVRITRYRGGVVHGHEPDEPGSFAVGRCY